jgi:hypothetical protein
VYREATYECAHEHERTCVCVCVCVCVFMGVFIRFISHSDILR